jgi:fructooligosaccharide transport system substrate-binding protein
MPKTVHPNATSGQTRRSFLSTAGSAGAALPAVLLAACGDRGARQAPTAGRREAPVTLSFLSWRPPAMTQFAPSWREFSQKSNIIIEVDDTGDGNQEKITAMFAADSGPDLFDANTRNLPAMYNSGFVLQIDPYLTRDRVNLDRDWGMLGIERWRQRTYGVPYWVEPFSIYYNKSLFQQRGVQDPWERSSNRGDWTVEEMVDAARRINDPANDVWGLDWGYTDYHGIGPLIWTQGVSHLQYDPEVEFKLQLPEVVEAHGWAIDWAMRQQINITAAIPEAAQSRERIQGGRVGIGAGGVNRFSQGKIGIHYRSVNDWRRMWNIIGTSFEWDMLPVPSVKGRPGAAWTAGHPVCAYSKTRHPDECWEFMHWLMEDEFQAILAEDQFLVPAKKNHQERFFRPPEQYSYQHPQVFANVFKRPYGIIWTHFNAAENSSTWSNEIAKVFRGELGLTSGLREMERLLNQQIDYGGGENPFKGIRWPIQPT